jgi:hypothetical protein
MRAICAAHLIFDLITHIMKSSLCNFLEFPVDPSFLGNVLIVDHFNFANERTEGIIQRRKG